MRARMRCSLGSTLTPWLCIHVRSKRKAAWLRPHAALSSNASCGDATVAAAVASTKMDLLRAISDATCARRSASRLSDEALGGWQMAKMMSIMVVLRAWRVRAPASLLPTRGTGNVAVARCEPDAARGLTGLARGEVERAVAARGLRSEADKEPAMRVAMANAEGEGFRHW